MKAINGAVALAMSVAGLGGGCALDEQEYGPYSFKSQGTYRTSSARASGSLLGTAFDDAYGFFGDTKQTNVSKYVIQTPHP